MFRKIFISFLALVMLFIPLNSYSDSGKSIVLKINSKTAFVNFQPVTLDVAPIEIKGRTLVPLRFISEHFGAKKISYFADTQEIALELDDPTALREENTKLLDKNKTLDNENISLKTENSNLKTENESLKNKIRDLENQKPPNPQIQLPSAPLDLQGYVSNKQVILSWRASSQGTYPISGYRIYRMEQGYANFVTIAVLQSSVLTFTDSQVFDGKVYIYYAKSFDTAYPINESIESNRVTIQMSTTQPPPPPPQPPTYEWQLQYTFKDLYNLYNLKDVYIKEDDANYYFQFTTYRSWKYSTDFGFALWVDKDQNKYTGMKTNDGKPIGNDFYVGFYFNKSDEFTGYVSDFTNSETEGEIVERLSPQKFSLESRSLTISVSKKYFILNRAFDYHMMIDYDDDYFDAEFYPSTGNLTYPKSVSGLNLLIQPLKDNETKQRNLYLKDFEKRLTYERKKKTPDPAYYSKFI